MRKWFLLGALAFAFTGQAHAADCSAHGSGNALACSEVLVANHHKRVWKPHGSLEGVMAIRFRYADRIYTSRGGGCDFPARLQRVRVHVHLCHPNGTQKVNFWLRYSAPESAPFRIAWEQD